jgi:hypothetical protein
MIDFINRQVGRFIRPANQPMLWIDCLIARFKPTFTTSAALNSVYSFGLVALSTWAVTLQPQRLLVAIPLDVMLLYILTATETEAVWKGVLLASGRPAKILRRTPGDDDRIPPSPKSLFLGVGGYGCTILCFASLAFLLHASRLAEYSGVKCASGLNFRCWWEFFYFSATTITTIGLSDIRPASPLPQALALIEIALGLFFVVFVFATFVSIQAAPKKRV